ncbi:glycogen synthase GlgA [Humitalea rosea]|nr:glycogen synthase GlgA [Humitalea rosea]
MQVLAVAPEVFPLVKTGGLADVVGALPHALAAHDVAVTTLLPGYRGVLAQLAGLPGVSLAWDAGAMFGGPARVLATRIAGLDVFVLDAPHLYDRPGGPYAGPDGVDWADNGLRFGALGAAADAIARGAIPGFSPAVVHAHDWQSGMAIARLHFGAAPRPATVFTVHNLAFQGQFDRGLLGQLGLPERAFSLDGVEHWGQIGFLKAGLALADRITTVSPTYAAEIRTPEAGMGLDGLLRARTRDLRGILNGIDTTIWDPARDPHLAAANPRGRARNKAALQARMGLDPDPGAPLFGVISRLSWQKGLDMLPEALPALLVAGGQLALLGSGDHGLEAAFRAAAAAHPGRIAAVFALDEPIAHLIQGGADAILVPSRFEPCGLTQLCALRYGAIPVVARTGGLADTVIDANVAALEQGQGTGIVFSPTNAPMLEAAILRTISLFHDRPVWKRLQHNAMRGDVSWARPAAAYASLYRDIAA